MSFSLYSKDDRKTPKRQNILCCTMSHCGDCAFLPSLKLNSKEVDNPIYRCAILLLHGTLVYVCVCRVLLCNIYFFFSAYPARIDPNLWRKSLNLPLELKGFEGGIRWYRIRFLSMASSTSICSCLHSSLQKGVSPLHTTQLGYHYQNHSQAL